MNWNRLMGQLLPNRMREAVRLRRLLQVLTGHTVGDAMRAEAYKEAVKAEHRNIGQTAVVLQLLHEKFSPEIAIEGQEDGNVKLFGRRDPYVRICGAAYDQDAVLTDVEHADVGCDFVVKVPSRVSPSEVAAYVRKFVLAGVGFRVETNQNTRNRV